MLADHFPLVGLRLSTPQRELRLPSSEEALSGALEHNLPSLAVSRKLGYQPDGHQRHALDGRMVVEHRLCLTRSTWQRHRSVPVNIDGLAPCLPLLGVSGS